MSDEVKRRAARSGKLQSLTKRINKVKSCMVESASDDIIRQLRDEIQQILQECKAANEEYVTTLDEEESIIAAYTWLVDVEEKASDCFLSITEYLTSAYPDEEAVTPDTKPIGVNQLASPSSNTDPRVDVSQAHSLPNPGHTDPPSPATVTDSTVPMPRPLDAWIDDLIPYRETVISKPNTADQGEYNDLILRAMFEREAPKPIVESCDGTPLQWPKFVDSFYESIHRQPYFTDVRRMALLQNHTKGKAKELISGYGNDGAAYAVALKELKRRFGHRSLVSRAYIDRLTTGPVLEDHNRQQLHTLYVNVRDCIFVLRRLDYEADITSSDVTRRTTARLPDRLRNRWSEQCCQIRLRDKREPNLYDMEHWLSQRVEALFDPILPDEDNSPPPRINKSAPRKVSSSNFAIYEAEQIGSDKDISPPPPLSSVKVEETHNACPACNASHRVYKCPEYKAMSPDKRIELVVKSRLCINCLLPGHRASSCSSPNTCHAARCRRKHHSTLHASPRINLSTGTGNKSNVRPAHREDNSRTPPPVAKQPDSTPETASTMATATNRSTVMLQIAPVYLNTAEGNRIPTYAFLDTGSQPTLIDRNTARLLAVEGTPSDLTLGTLNDESVIRSEQISGLSVSPRWDPTIKFDIPRAWTVESLNNIPAQRLSPEIRSLPHLSDLQLEDIDPSMVKILIGGNVPDAILPREIRRGPPGTPTAVLTGLAWTLLGVSDIRTKDIERQVRVFQTTENTSHLPSKDQDDLFVELLQRLWTTESFGCKFEGEPSTSVEDREAIRALESRTQLIDGKYHVPMLWKDVSPILPTNSYNAALRRHHLTGRRLTKDPSLLEKWKEAHDTWIQRGYAKKMTPAEIKSTTPITFYLPLHPVLSPNKPDKVRPVHDAAARVKGVSLNDKLLSGPDLLNSLPGILIRFRRGEIGMSADIESMFHRVHTLASDSDCLRFLYSDDPSNSTPDHYQMCVHIFGAKCSLTCSVYALQRCATDKTDQTSPEVTATIMKSFYVDDLLTSCQEEDDAIALAKELIRVLQLGNFRLTKWASNSRRVLSALPSSELAQKNIKLDFDELPVERALGQCWSTESDELVFKQMKPLDNSTPTMRSIIRTVASLFDPLGFLSPFTLRAKCLLQSLHRIKYGWDTELSGDFLRTWQSWVEELDVAMKFKIPRCYSIGLLSSDHIELHIYADASEVAFGVVAYLRTVLPSGTINVSYVISKCRLAPIKALTIPRLELQSAVQACRLYIFLREQLSLKLARTVMWSDSMITLQQINNTSKRLNVYASNRVQEILDATPATWWHHVPTHLNPADDCSRGLDSQELIRQDHRFICGPAYLKRPEDEWPTAVKIEPLPDDHPELKIQYSVAAVSVTSNENLFDPHRFSKLGDLIRRTAWILRFCHNLRAKVGNQLAKDQNQYGPLLDLRTGNVTPLEMHGALMYWIQGIQCTAFAKEITALSSGKPVPVSSSIVGLQPMLVDGILRVGGRLNNANIPYDARHQLIMPKHHHITSLIVRDAHIKSGHAGQEQVLANLRQRYWIPRARTLVRSLLRSCIMCRKRNARPQVPVMSDLPQTRLAMGELAFTHSACDFAGPVFIKRARGRREKRYICLFTCMVVRAIHLELAVSLDTPAFINCLQRFANRRGSPVTITCDNGTNFRGAARELYEAFAALDQTRIADKLSTQGIEWKFNPPSSPHFGGVFEVLIRCVKSTLHTVIGEGPYHEDTLATALTYVEAVVNSRPLTAVSNDPTDYECLTPNHFLFGKANPQTPPDVPITELDLRKRWTQVQLLADHAWTRFKREYVPQLNNRRRWNKPMRKIAAGDLVLISDENLPRCRWAMGRVVRPLPGKDGRVRVAEVQTTSGQKIRPVAKLCLLEASG